MPAFWVVLFQNHLVMKTNVIYSLHITSHGLPPHSSRLFKATSYCGKEYQLLISNSRFSARLNLILINCMFKCLRDAERRKKDPHFHRAIGKLEKQQFSIGPSVFSSQLYQATLLNSATEAQYYNTPDNSVLTLCLCQFWCISHKWYCHLFLFPK